MDSIILVVALVGLGIFSLLADSGDWWMKK